jgi:hypothetical protein
LLVLTALLEQLADIHGLFTTNHDIITAGTECITWSDSHVSFTKTRMAEDF